MRRLALTALLALTGAVLLCGCGKGGFVTHTTTTAHAHHGGAVPSKAQAAAIAGAINLRRGDVPGFAAVRTPSSHHESAAERKLQEQLRKCTGAPAVVSLADVNSPEFKRAEGPFSQTISSGVSVAESPAAAASGLAALHRANVRGCLTRYVQATLATRKFGKLTVAPVSVAAGTPPAPGTSGSFGWRVTSGLDFHRLRIPFYMDLLGFVRGRAEVTLVSFGIPTAFPARTEEQAFTLLLARAATLAP